MRSPAREGNERTGVLMGMGRVGGWRCLRLAVLTGFLAGSFVLLRWNREGDPRFFAFLETRPGRAMSRLFGWWGNSLDRPPWDKPDAMRTEGERRIKEEMEAALRDAVTRAGNLAASYYAPRVTYRDVAFRMEFSEFHLLMEPPFVVLSDAGAEELQALLQELGNTYRQFAETFHPLFADVHRNELIHLLYFRRPAEYLAYQEEHAIGMHSAAGFYSPAANRLVLFRQAGDPAPTPNAGDARQTLLTIRHEAGHQFLFAHGVHSDHRIEHDWLIEGLASYCEPDRTGDADPLQTGVLENALRANHLIPLPDLVNRRGETGLLGYQTAELAYSESWSLVHFLMQPAHRDAFFAYIRFVRDPANFRAVKRTERFQLLADHLGMSRGDLQDQWHTHLRHLTAPPGTLPNTTIP